MYRRKTPKANPVQPVEHPKKEEKNEPVIKAVVAAPRGDQITTYCPMINTLRPIKYIERGAGDEGVSVPFDTMIDIVLADGYLRGDFDHYKEGVDGTISSWRDIYTDSTGYKRSTFVAGDVIFTRDGKKTIAFLINTVYKGGVGSSKTSELAVDSPVSENKDDQMETYLSSFSDCKGNVFMFEQGVKFLELVNHKNTKNDVVRDLVSKWTSGSNKDEYRKLEPTNMSVYDKANPNMNNEPTFTEPKRGETKYIDPTENYYPEEPKTSATSFQLTSGVTVDGWLIYMYSTAETVTPASIVGDIIRTGPIVITTVGSETLSLGGIFTFPWIATGATSGKFTYTGNATRFASEPLNSQHYQLNFGNTVADENLDVTESQIHTFKKFTKVEA